MHWWWGQGTEVSWIGMILGPIMMIAMLVVAIAIVAVIAAVIARAFGFGTPAPSSTKTARDILDERFARRDIDRDEYLDRKKLITGG
jgi:uncharacterized membrane protein